MVLGGSTRVTPYPVPGPERMLSVTVVRTVEPMAMAPGTVAVAVGVREGVAVAPGMVGVRVGVAVPRADTYSAATQPLPKDVETGTKM